MLNPNYRYVTGILPDTLRRTDARLDWLYLLAKGLESAYDNAVIDIDDFKYLFLHNYQVLSLEHLLNDRLNPNYDIQILDGNWLDYIFLYINGEQFSEPTYLYTKGEIIAGDTPTYLYGQSEYDDDQVDFIIQVNSVDSDLEDLIIYYVDLYKPGGKTYEIQFV